MKVFLSRASLALSLVCAMVLTGCAITPPMTETANKAARLSTTTATPGVDGLAVTAAILDIQEIDPKTGENAGMWKRTVQIYQSLPTAGEVVKGFMGGMGAAIVQSEAAKEVAKIGNCDGKGCGGGTPIQVYSISGAESSQTSTLVNEIKTGAPVPTCGAACSTKHAN